MKTPVKQILLAASTAIICSAATAVAVTSATAPDRAAFPAAGEPEGGAFYTVANSVTPATDFTKAAESTINGVVSIKSFSTPRGYAQQGGGQGFFGDPFFEYFFGQPQQRQQPQQREKPREQQRGLGSGVIISKDGYIVTNNHVIDEAERLEVTLNDNRTFDATVIGADPTTDLALIKIDATDLPVIPMGDSEQLKVGEWVLAVGNPFGFTSTVTTGIVSAKSRSISGVSHSRPMGIESYI
ncbi:MAG: S1C family serine protease, partial [Duncaniella sp.]|nr:S1C family serine protease [Duncaniella sp.]